MSLARSGLSLAILVTSAATMILAVTLRLVDDASFWQDEAAIAYNLISMSPLELLGRFDSGHQFPRLYLAAVNQLRFAFGYETIVLRALPFAFFVAGVLLWHGLLWRRFRARPALLMLGVALTMAPGQWLAYGAMFKQYSLDVCVALLPFLLSDDTLARRWRDGVGTPRLLVWMLPILVSYSYGIAILGRLVGYWLGTLRARGWRPPLVPTLWLVAGFGLAFGASWAIDLRHALQDNAALGFWKGRGCVTTGEPWADAGLLARWGVDWLGAGGPFGGRRPVPTPIVTMLVAVGLAGAAQALIAAIQGAYGHRAGLDAGASGVAARRGERAFVTGPSSPAAAGEAVDRAAWGTRSCAALVTVGGLFAAAVLLAYPVCANRLTLFASFSWLLLVLEGASLVAAGGERWLDQRWLEIVPALLAVGVLPSAAATIARIGTEDAPENVRPLLPIIATVPDRPIVVGRCSSEQLLTLPEWIERGDVYYVDRALQRGDPTLPDATEFWLVSAGGYRICPGWTDQLRAAAATFRIASTGAHTATLVHVTLPPGSDRRVAEPDGWPRRVPSKQR